jgi:hypothetical protein
VELTLPKRLRAYLDDVYSSLQRLLVLPSGQKAQTVEQYISAAQRLP